MGNEAEKPNIITSSLDGGAPIPCGRSLTVRLVVQLNS